jgi:membrane protein implicated in regulation of membrane protease activity
MNTALLLKIAVWMVVIGVAALLAPNPAWPESAARVVLSLGIALAVTSLVAPYFTKSRRKAGKKNKD